MGIKCKNISARVFAWAMIAMMGMLIANKAIFLHTHRLANGKIVVHSHPYKTSDDSEPYKTHHHSNPEYFILSSLYLLFWFAVLILSLLLVFKNASLLIFHTEKQLTQNPLLPRGRAPPFYF